MRVEIEFEREVETMKTERSQDEIEALKEQWNADSIWDIENTEGFEAHYEELLAYRLRREAEWKAGRENDLAERAAESGVSIPVMTLIYNLEFQIVQLQKQIDKLSEVKL